MLNLGDRAKDVISGFSGIVVGRTTWLYGCDRVGLQGEKLGKDGRVSDVQWFDAAQVVVVKAGVVKGAPAQMTGGPARGEETRRPVGR